MKLADSDMWDEQKPKLRIGIVGDGHSIHIRRWGRWLREHGHYVAMLSTTDVQGQDSHAELKDDYDLMWTVKVRAGPLGYLSAIIEVRSFVRSLRLDLVHGMYLTNGGFIASCSGAKKKVVSAWGPDIFKDAKQSRVKRFMVKYSLKHATQVFVDSIALECEVAGLARVRAKIIRFGANLEKFRPRGIKKYDKFTMLSIRKSEPLYNPIEIVKAFEEVASGMDARLLLQRPTSKEYDVLMAVWNSPFKERIGFWDERPHESMPELYGSAHVGISMPDSDGCSVAVIECMACGTPVIMSLTGAMELVEYPYCADQGTKHNQLSDAMAFMYKVHSENPEQFIEMGRKARERAERYGNFELSMHKAEDCYYGMAR